MASTITKNRFKEIIQNPEITKEQDLQLLQTIYFFPDHCASATQIAKILGHKNKIVTIGIMTHFGKRISKYYNIDLTKRDPLKFKYWDLFFKGWYEGNFFIWKLLTPLEQALEELNLVNEFHYSEELPEASTKTYPEGLRRSIIVNAYERNSAARQKCIDHYGLSCVVCNFNFEDFYGLIGKDYIHVHHLTPLSEINKSYEVDPIKDLIPVCPNCHAMLHEENPPFSLTEIRSRIKIN